MKAMVLKCCYLNMFNDVLDGIDGLERIFDGSSSGNERWVSVSAVVVRDGWVSQSARLTNRTMRVSFQLGRAYYSGFATILVKAKA